jgi:RNase P/RNase MRP subunit p29
MSNANNKRPSNIRKENKDKDNAVGSKFSWMEDGKSLSKNLLYTPLVAYHKAAAAAASAAASVDDNDNDDVNKRSNQHHPSQYMSMKSSVPKSLQEVSLVAFLHTVSCDYHRNGTNLNQSTTGGGGVSSNDAKNNGSRPLGKNDIEGRIRQRAVTLIGGGINSSLIPTNKTFQERTSLSSNNNNKKRRQRSWEEIEPILLKNKMNMKKNNQNNDNNDDVISFLQELNVAWNEYIWKVISNPPSFSNKKPNDKTKNNNDEAQLQNLHIPSLIEIEYQLIALTRINDNKINSNSINSNSSRNNNNDNNYRPLELIGSHVRIESCNSHRSWIGRFGILIGETTNTYRIAGYSSTTKRGRKKKKKTKREHTKESSDVISSSTTNASDVVKEEHQYNYDEVEIFLLPKRGSSMVLIVPVPFDTTSTTTTSSSCVNNNNKDGRDANKNIISLPDKAICISIIDPDDIIK